MSAKGWDYVVIGAGAAGCVVAGRLSEMLPAARIALIEAGRERLGLTTKVPGIAFIASTFARQNWNYQTEPVPALNGRRLSWFQGRILGGSSSINGMLYLRGHSLEYDQWAQRGCQGWSFDQVLPYFKKAETNSRGAGKWHGADGPVAVKQSRLDLPICDAFLAAAGEAGYPVVDDLNADVTEGFGRIDTNISGGRRASMAVAFAQPGRRRGKLDLLSEAVAARIIIESGRAKGVEIIRKGMRETVWAEREVILCGGTVNSPQLLMLSGVGPADHLIDTGIEPVVDSPGVGANLSDHPVLPVIWATPRLRGLWEKTGNAGALRWRLTHRGPVASNVAESGGFAHSEPGLPAPDLRLHVLPALYRDQGLADATERAMTVLVGLVDVKSRGRIRLRSADPRHRPAIDPGYLSDGGGDARALLAGLKMAREFVTARPMAAICRSEIAPGPHVRSDGELLDYITNSVVTLYHPVGTCAMGSEARWGSVVDPELKVRGISGLRVVDASVMPTVPRGNTNAPTIAIAERAADLIAGRAPLAPADP